MVEVERDSAGRTRAHAGAAAVVVAAVALAQLALVWAVLDPRTFFAGDAGVKYLQAANLLASDWRGASLRNPADRVDPDYRFTVFSGPHYARRAEDAPYHGVYGALFTVPVAAALQAFGARGMYLVPILGNIGTMVLVYLLARRTAPRTAWLAPLLVGACSPMFFYSLDLWEHTLATMLATAAVLAISAAPPIGLRRCALAGVALAGAIAVREEMYAFLPAVLVGMAWSEPRRRLPAAFVTAASAGIALLPYWWLKWTQTGAPARIAVARLLYGTTGIAKIGVPETQLAAGAADWRASVWLVAPLLAVWLLPLAAAIALRFWLPRASARWQSSAVAALALIAVGWAWADLALLWATWQRPNALLQAFPVALFLLFAPPGVARSAPLQVPIIAGVFVLLSMIAGPIALREAPLGGAQYGPRLLMPAFALLSVCIVFVLERRGAWGRRAPFAPALLAGTFALLVLASLLVQAHGVRELRKAKRGYEQLVQATERLEANSVVATDLWWYPQATAAVLYERQTVRVDFSPETALPNFLARLRGDPAATLTLVSEDGALGERHAAALSDAHWAEVGRQRVPIWIDVHLVSYRRQLGGPRS